MRARKADALVMRMQQGHRRGHYLGSPEEKILCLFLVQTPAGDLYRN